MHEPVAAEVARVFEVIRNMLFSAQLCLGSRLSICCFDINHHGSAAVHVHAQSREAKEKSRVHTSKVVARNVVRREGLARVHICVYDRSTCCV